MINFQSYRIKQMILVSTFGLFAIGSNAQADDAKKAFVPHGQPFVKVFFNSHSSLFEETSKSAFELETVFLGTTYKMSEQFSVKLNVELEKPMPNLSDSTLTKVINNYTGYLKDAYMSYKTEKFSFSAGMIRLGNFKLQNEFWGHRYLMKSMQGQYKIAPSSDLGMEVVYSPVKALSMDLTIRNGEGYRKLQIDDNYNFAVGMTARPMDRIVMRAHYEYAQGNLLERSAISGFIGYKYEKMVVGTEITHVINDSHKTDQNKNGMSTFGSYKLSKKVELFGRYDLLSSNTIQDQTVPWNINKDGSLYLAGVQVTPVKGIKAALNMRVFDPAKSGESLNSMLYLNFQYAFK